MSAPAPAGAARQVSLTRLSAEIGHQMSDLGRVTTEGEVVKPKVMGSGTIYFTLKDRAAQLGVYCPASRARRCRAVHGERVAVTGALSWSPDRGQVSLYAEEVLPVGAGAIAAAIAECRRRLVADGLIGRPPRRAPALPRAIGVICGAEAAVRADIESVVAQRFEGYPVRWREVPVSGPGAVDSLVGALAWMAHLQEVEVVILARGGGDAASLLAFSNEEVCRAIGASLVPVVSAIGHHGDRPLCDEVADLRCATPSLAAMAVVPDRAALAAHAEGLITQARRVLVARSEAAGSALARQDRSVGLRAGLVLARRRLEGAGRALGGLDLGRRTGAEIRRLRGLDWRSPLRYRLGVAGAELAVGLRTLEALDPARVLGRGYAVVRGPGGVVLRDPAQVGPGAPLGITLARGALAAQVTGPGRQL